MTKWTEGFFTFMSKNVESVLQSYEQKIIVCSTRIQIEFNKIYQSAHIANTH